jgi:hypothetical protein
MGQFRRLKQHVTAQTECVSPPKEAAMNRSDSSPSLFTRWLGRRVPSADDAADYGTAFGLELSMEEGLPQAPEGPASPQAAPSRGWLPLWLHF